MRQVYRSRELVRSRRAGASVLLNRVTTSVRRAEDVCVHDDVFGGLWQQHLHRREGDVGMFNVRPDELLDSEPRLPRELNVSETSLRQTHPS